MASFKEECVMKVLGHPGTGSITTDTAVPGFQSLGSADNGLSFYILIRTIDAEGQTGSGLWEVHTSTWTNSTSNLSRGSGTVVDGSSGPGTLVNFSAGEQEVHVVYKAPAGGGSGTVNPTFQLAIGTPVTTGVNKTNVLIAPTAITITKAFAYAKTAPTGAALIFDINLNGTTIWATQANRLQLSIASNTGTQTLFDTTAVAEGDLLTIDVDQIGSTVAGQDITVTLYCVT